MKNFNDLEERLSLQSSKIHDEDEAHGTFSNNNTSNQVVEVITKHDNNNNNNFGSNPSSLDSNFISISSQKDNHCHDRIKIISWNMWCVPYGSPRTLSNPERCSNYLKQLSVKQEWNKYNGLILVGLQELWCWQTGIFPPLLLRLIGYLETIPYFGRIVSIIFQFLSMIIGLIPLLKCLPIKYDPKTRVINRLKTILPYSYKVSRIPIVNLLENGLLILSNQKYDDCGFIAFSDSACDDSLAQKGFLWVYYKDYSTIFINTHLQAAGDGKERVSQIEQLRKWIDIKWRDQVHKIIVVGDMNIDMREERYLQTPEPTIINNNNNIDNKDNNNNNNVALLSINNNNNSNNSNNTDTFNTNNTNNSDYIISFQNVNSNHDDQQTILLPSLGPVNVPEHLNFNDNDNDNDNNDNNNDDDDDDNDNDSKSNNMEKELSHEEKSPENNDQKEHYGNNKRQSVNSITVTKSTENDNNDIPAELNMLEEMDGISPTKSYLLRKPFVNIGDILDLNKISDYRSTFVGHDWNIDHILANFQNLHDNEHCKMTTTLFGDEMELSDHYLVMVDCKCNQ